MAPGSHAVTLFLGISYALARERERFTAPAPLVLRCELGKRGGGLVGSAQGLQVYAELLAFLVQMAAF